ncbi:MAG: 6-pyruvoyl tetrahydrobiopterin synthase [Dehalococcoidia bacterium]|nr:6-pyruvoyl tetrahydrobiopterin synthase [Dehalococcoidia bacterium]
MSGSFQVRVEGVQFAAAHCATIGETCEPMHGHSYEVAAEVDGALAENSWVVDFVELKSILRKLCHELDHRFMLQTESRILKIESREGEWEVRTPAGAVYVLPASDVVALPIDNTTAERLAQWLSGRVWQAVGKKAVNNIKAVTVEVWEGPGQRAAHRRERLPVD